MKKIKLTWIGILGISVFTLLHSQVNFAQCSLTCNGSTVQISLDGSCLAEVTPDDILEGANAGCTGSMTVQVFDASGNVVPNNPVVDGNYVGQILVVRVTHDASGNYCEGAIDIRDYIKPVVTCSNLSLACNMSTHPDDIGYATVADNCDNNVVLSYTDNISDPMCDPSLVQIITRTWTAEDASGNISAPCVQTISLLRPVLANIQFPANKDDVESPSLDCVNPDISPANTGYPSLGGVDLINGAICEIWVMHSDSDPFPICQGSSTIIRTWTISDECGNNTVTDTQIIKVKDKTDPEIICPDDFTVSAIATACAAYVTIPPATATDNCSSNANISISITNADGDLVIPNSTLYLPVGIYAFTYTATDDCDNSAQCILEITVDDGANPVVVCESSTTLSLGGDGLTLVPANVFDDGSYDNCGPITFLARRMDNPACPGEDSSDFNTSVPFYCCDVGNIVMVEMMVEDAINRLSNSCMVEVIVQDKLNPLITCPPDTILDCDQFPADPTVTGEPEVYDNCGIADVSYTDSLDLDACNTGMIFRTWTVTDVQGQLAVCLQKITLVDTIAPVIIFPPNIDVTECGEALDPNITGEPEIDDGCGLFGVGKEDINLEFNGGCMIKIIRIWTVYDWCKDTTYTDIQVIQEFDTEPPVFNATPMDMTVECDAVPPTDILTATDDCDNGANIIMSETIDPGSCEDEYFIIRQWITADNCGNTDTLTQMITVVDTTPPVISGESPDTTLNCDAIIPVPALIFSDNCDNNVNVEMTENEISGSCEDAFVIVRTWIATDNCGNQAQRIQHIMVQDTVAPVLLGVPMDISVECDMVPAPPVIGIDITAIDNCDVNVEIAFNQSIQAGSCPDNFSLTRTWTATDNCGNQTTAFQMIQVDDTTPPVLSGVPTDMTVECGNVPPAPTVTATDNCVPNIMVVFDEDVVPGICPENVTVTRTWTATDNCGNTTSAQQVITSADTEAPILSGVPTDMTVECGNVPPAPTVTATDNCVSNIMVVFDEDVVPGICLENVTVTRTWTATDNCGNTTSAQQVITSADTEAPVLSGVPMDMTVECGNVPPAPTVTATDNCVSNIMVVFEEDVVPGICLENVTVTRTWTATDNCGNTTSAQQVITSADTEAPVLSGVPMDMTVECGNVPPAPTVTATDNCVPNIMVVFDEDIVPGICLENVTVTRTWTATDNCGNTTSAQQVITSADTESPVLSGVPMDMTVECGNVPPAPTVTATDNCVPNIMVVFDEDIVPGNCSENITVTRTWTATDNCGNTTSAQQVITSADTEAPVINDLPPDITVQCDAIPMAPVTTATDNCDGDVDLVFEEIITEQNCLDEYVLLWIWTATDNCGNSTADTTSLEVIDDTAPILFGVPSNITLECDEVMDPPFPTATDNCDAEPEVLFSELINDASCENNSYKIFRTWTGVDNCGNQSIRTQIITVSDNTPPMIECPNDTILNITVAGTSSIAYTLIPVVEDNCDTSPQVSFQIDFGNNGTIDSAGIMVDSFLTIDFPIGDAIVTFEAEDACGNIAACSTQITVIGMVPPGFAIIAGQIFTEENEYLQEVEVNLNGGISEVAMTSQDGYYEFSQVPQGNNYFIEPFNNQNPVNGVSTFDVIMMQRHILEIELLDSPYKIIAADINQSGDLSTLDVVELRQLILGIIPAFQTNTSWRFVDANYLFPNAENPFASSFPEFCSINNLNAGMPNMDFVGVKTGDVNNSAETNVQGGSDTRNTSTFHFNTEEQFLEKEDMLIVPIRASDFTNVLGFQYNLQYDPNDLEFAGIGESRLPFFSLENLGFNFTDQGILTCSWHTANEVSINPEEVLFELKFKVKSKGRLSDFLSLNSAYITAELYQAGSEISGLDLQFKTSPNPKVAKAFELFQNRPNPFKAETIIGFSLKERTEAILSVFNASGKLIVQSKGIYTEGYHEIFIRKDQLEGNGMYFYQLKTPSGNAQRKMVLVE